jgi:hypothetical protein
MTLGKGWFAECQLDNTRQRIVKDSLPSVIQPSASDLALGKEYFNIFKKSLPSARSRALGKAYFKNKKNLCRVPDRGHSIKK